MTLTAATPPHVARVLEALATRDILAAQNGEPNAWHGRCPACGGELTVLDVDWDETGRRKVRLSCDAHIDDRPILSALGLRERDLFLEEPGPAAAETMAAGAKIVTLGEFVAVEEPGAAPLLGDAESILIPEGGDVMLYGDGGAGKTTLMFDAAFHLAAGQDWLQIPVSRPTRILLIENEGPRPLLRQKLRRKLEAWDGPEPDGRISVFEQPWGKFTFAEEVWRQLLASRVTELEIDVVIAGPLTRLGMDSAGTLQEVVSFARCLEDVRDRCGRLLTVILVHHENKGGAVSGAWEGAGDTLLHMQAAGNGHSVLFVQKARWASSYHHTSLKLAWTDGEGFELEGDRDYVSEIRELLSGGGWRTVKQIMASRDDGGIGAGEKAIREVLEQQAELFEMRTGDAAKALGRAATSKIYGLRSAASAVGAVGAVQGGGEGVTAPAPPLKGAGTPGTPRMFDNESAPEPERSSLGAGWNDDDLQALVDQEDDG